MATFLAEHTFFPGESRVIAGRPIIARVNSLGVGLVVNTGPPGTSAFDDHVRKYFLVQATEPLPDVLLFLGVVTPPGEDMLHALYGIATDEMPWEA